MVLSSWYSGYEISAVLYSFFIAPRLTESNVIVRFVVLSVSGITHKCLNGRRPNIVGARGAPLELEVINFWW